MRVTKQWQDQNDPDGFANIFELEDGSLVFTTEKVAVWRDVQGDILETSYKGGFRENPAVTQALDEIGPDVEILPFDGNLRSLYERCIDTEM